MITADKLKFRDMTPTEKEKVLEYITKKNKNHNMIISLIILLVLTSNFIYSIINSETVNISSTVIFYIVILIISSIPLINYILKKKMRIYRIKTNNIKCVQAMCPYGKYYGHSRKRVNNRRVYEINTEFESRMVIEPYSIYGNPIKAKSEFYIIKFGKKDVIYLNIDFEKNEI